MKITELAIHAVKASPRGDWYFLQINTDEGIFGIGEASQSGNDRLLVAALKDLESRLIGLDPTQPEVLWENMVRSSNIFSGAKGRIGATAVSAIDQALWDLTGKFYDVPIWRLLGGKHRERVRLYANLNRATSDRSPQGFADIAAKAVDAGFQAVKATPFDEVHWSNIDRHGLNKDVEKGIRRLESTRRAIGDDVELLVDCHQRFDISLAMTVAEKVKPLNLYWFEEPVPSNQLEAMRHLTLHSGHRIAGGEALFGREQFWDYISDSLVHVIMPDVKHAGGITECRRIAAMAEVRQIPIAPHSPAGPISSMAGVHIAATVPNFSLLEYAFGEVDWRTELVFPNESVVDGYIEVPDHPGLGLDLDPEMIAKHRVA